MQIAFLPSQKLVSVEGKQEKQRWVLIPQEQACTHFYKFEPAARRPTKVACEFVSMKALTPRKGSMLNTSKQLAECTHKVQRRRCVTDVYSNTRLVQIHALTVEV